MRVRRRMKRVVRSEGRFIMIVPLTSEPGGWWSKVRSFAAGSTNKTDASGNRKREGTVRYDERKRMRKGVPKSRIID